MTFRKGASGNPAGRPKGAICKINSITERQRVKLAKEGVTPLELLRSIMRDPETELEMRLEAARIAAPFMHRRMPIAMEGSDQFHALVFEASALIGLSSPEKLLLCSLLEEIGIAAETSVA